jgi:hypothetical protein
LPEREPPLGVRGRDSPGTSDASRAKEFSRACGVATAEIRAVASRQRTTKGIVDRGGRRRWQTSRSRCSTGAPS